MVGRFSLFWACPAALLKWCLYWLTRPVAKGSIYPGAVPALMAGTAAYRRWGSEVLLALGGERRPVRLANGILVDGMVVDARRYAERWPQVSQQCAGVLRSLGMDPEGHSMAAALGMPRLRPWTGRQPAIALVLPGNAMLYEFSLPEVAAYLDRGISVRLFNYPGFGDSGGTPNAASTCAAGEAVYEDVRRQYGFEAMVVLHGISLGGGVAACLMRRHHRQDPHLSAVLDRTFSSLGAVARDMFPLPGLHRLIDWLYSYPVEDWVADLYGRVTVVRVQHDMIMYPYHAERIARKVIRNTPGADPSDVIIDASGGHNHGDNGEPCWLYDAGTQALFGEMLQKNSGGHSSA